MSKQDFKMFFFDYVESAERLKECIQVIGKEKMQLIAKELKQDPEFMELIKRISDLEDSQMADWF